MKLHMNDAQKSYYVKAVRQSLFSYQAVQSIADLIYWLEKHQSSGSRGLTPNRPLIQLWCARSKLNMDEICSLNNHL